MNKYHKTKNVQACLLGYKALKKSGNMSLVKTIKNKLVDTCVFKEGYKVSSFFFKLDSHRAEIVIRQFLSSRLLNLSFNKALLISIGSNNPIIYPLPKEWQHALIKSGIDVSTKYCSLLWYLFGWKMLLNGIFFFIKYTAQSFLGAVYKSSKKTEKFVYFSGLTKSNLPKSSSDNKSYNLINWYLARNPKGNEINSLCHDVHGVEAFKIGNANIGYLKYPFLPISDFTNLIKCFLWSFLAVFYATFNIARNNIWCAVILKEVIFTEIFRRQHSKALASEYMFHEWIYRPLWTYEAERKGSKIILYLYSINNGSERAEIEYDWRLSNWPDYLVWDDYSENFIKSAVYSYSKIHIVGPIWFSSGGKIENIPKDSISVFDVSPFQEDIYVILGETDERYVPKYVNKFLNDIHSVLKKNNITMAHKRKRHNPKIHKEYLKNIGKLKKQNIYIEADCELSPLEVIKKTKACISMPFTSTALIAKHDGKPSVFYDPNGLTQIDEKVMNGIPILTSIDELQQWIEEVNKV